MPDGGGGEGGGGAGGGGGWEGGGGEGGDTAEPLPAERQPVGSAESLSETLRAAADSLWATTAACQGQRCAPPESTPRAPEASLRVWRPILGNDGGVPAEATLRATRIDATRTRGPLRVAADPLRATTAACQGQRCAPPESSQPRVPRPPKRAAEGGALHHSWSCGVIGAANAAACRINAARQPLGSSTAHGRSRHVLLQPVCGPGG